MKFLPIFFSLIACIEFTSETTSKDINDAWQKSTNVDHSLEKREPQAWFLGYVEGKISVMPKFWQQAILNLDQSRLPNFAPNLELYEWQYHSTDIKDLPKTISIRRTDREFVLRIKEESIYIDSFLWREITSGRSGLTALATDKIAYLVTHDTVGGPIDIYALDRTNKTVIWKSTAKPNKYSPNRPSGVGFHHAEVIIHNDKLFVFGICDDLAYIVCHDESTGKHLWKFSTDDSK